MLVYFRRICILKGRGENGWWKSWGLPQSSSSSACVCLHESEGSDPDNTERAIRRCRKKIKILYSFSKPDIDFGVAGGKQGNDKSWQCSMINLLCLTDCSLFQKFQGKICFACHSRCVLGAGKKDFERGEMVRASK